MFRNSENISNQSEREELNPLEPDIIVDNDPDTRSNSPSNPSNSGSDSEANSEKSGKTDKKHKSEHLSRIERSERDRKKKLEAMHMEYTRSNPLGSALLDLVADNLALHKKLKYKKTNLRVGDLCTAFHDHMEIEREKVKKDLEASSARTELRILDKELHAYKCKENLPSPTKFSSRNILTTANARADAIRIFPTKNKFNGTESTNGMNIHEFLSLVNAAQKQMNLSREEFLEFLLMCTTGKPHILIKDWADNGDDIEEIYYHLFSHYDLRMSPEAAREKLSIYKARKNSNLNKVTSDIMQLALRSACVLPQGVARTASYNSEAVQALIRSLPSISSDLASNKYHTISSRLQRPATFAEVSRALSINAHTIDNEISKMGAPPGQSTFMGKQFHNNGGNNAHKSSRDKKPRSQQNTAFAVNVNPMPKRGGQHSGPPNNYGNGHNSGPPHNSGNGQHPQQSRKANAFFNQNPSSNPRNGNGNGKGRGGNTGNNGNNRNGNRGNPRYSGQQGQKNRNYCSMCGLKDHLATDGCPNMMDDMGRPIQAHPCQTTCPECPSSVSPRLNHSATYCPFRISGPLHGTK